MNSFYNKIGKRLISVLLCLVCTVTTVIQYTSFAMADSGTGDGSEYIKISNVDDTPNDDGIISTKTVEYNEDDGTYKIKMEAFSTAEVKKKESNKPYDIIMVFDTSSSMNQSIVSSNQDIETKLDALKCASKNFVNSIPGDSSSDNQLAIITYNDTSKVELPLSGIANNDITIDGKNSKDSICELINGIGTSVGTRTHLGLLEAENMLENTNDERNKIVILFTDGLPTIPAVYGKFYEPFANDAIKSAYNIKKDYDADIYSIGLFNESGSDLTNIGEFWDKKEINKTYYCYINENKYPIDNSSSYEYLSDNIKINRFLQFVSSNYLEENLGIPDNETTTTIEKEQKCGTIWYKYNNNNKNGEYVFRDKYKSGYQSTSKYFSQEEKTKVLTKPSPIADKYFILTSNADTLNNAFETVCQEIVTGISDVNEATIVDSITPYFELAVDKENSINVYQAEVSDISDDGKTIIFDEANKTKSTDSIAYISTQNQLQVKYNFNSNMCYKDSKGIHGNKIIIEITVKPKEKFMGGNNVPTNVKGSGIYIQNGVDEQGKVIWECKEEFSVPTANVKLRYDFSVEDKSIYVGQKATLSDMIKLDSDWFNGVNNAFVDTELTIGDEEITINHEEKKNLELGEILEPKVCTDYNVNCKIKPYESSSTIQGKQIPITGITSEDADYFRVNYTNETDKTYSVDRLNQSAKLHVFVPTITCSDITIFRGETTDLINRIDSVTWGDLLDNSIDVPKPAGEVPSLSYTFSEGGKEITNVSNYAPKSDLDVSTIKISKITYSNNTDTDITDYSIIANPSEKKDFTVSVVSGSVTVDKQIDIDKFDPNAGDAIFTIVLTNNTTGIEYSKTVRFTEDDYFNKLSSKKVEFTNLPYGNYTVDEESTIRYSKKSQSLTTGNVYPCTIDNDKFLIGLKDNNDTDPQAYLSRRNGCATIINNLVVDNRFSYTDVVENKFTFDANGYVKITKDVLYGSPDEEDLPTKNEE